MFDNNIVDERNIIEINYSDTYMFYNIYGCNPIF